jgi:ubiquinone/menaquinone biosynthesis C-methylase UbiE
MGTNIGDFLKEAYRILMKGGRIKIAEIRSRFEGKLLININILFIIYFIIIFYIIK